MYHTPLFTRSHPSARNLTDKQIDAIAESQGIIGVNFAVYDLRPDAKLEVEGALPYLLEHIEYLVDRMGIDCVGLGSDFDGTAGSAIRDAAALPELIEQLQLRGFDEESIAKICRKNWLRVAESSWRN